MERLLIEKYLAGENTPQEAQQLKLLLEAKSSTECSVEEQALLLMLKGIPQESEEDLFCADYSEEYEQVVRKNTRYKIGKAIAATIALAACIVAVWFIGNWKKESLDTHEPHEAYKIQQQESRPNVKEIIAVDSDSSIIAPNSKQPINERVKPEANHYAWAKALMESYKEDDLGEITDMADTKPRQEKDWAQK